MVNRQDCIRKLSEFKQNHGSEFRINQIGIFGSVARDENTDSSDIDIIVDINNPTLVLMYDLHERLENLFGCEVDVVRQRTSLSPSLKSNIQKDAIYV